MLACLSYSKRANELNQNTNESPVLMLTTFEVVETGGVTGAVVGTIGTDTIPRLNAVQALLS
jgi:hypothetical protein